MLDIDFWWSALFVAWATLFITWAVVVLFVYFIVTF